MKTKLLALFLLAGGCVFAQSVAVGVGVGGVGVGVGVGGYGVPPVAAYGYPAPYAYPYPTLPQRIRITHTLASMVATTADIMAADTMDAIPTIVVATTVVDVTTVVQSPMPAADTTAVLATTVVPGTTVGTRAVVTTAVADTTNYSFLFPQRASKAQPRQAPNLPGHFFGLMGCSSSRSHTEGCATVREFSRIEARLASARFTRAVQCWSLTTAPTCERARVLYGWRDAV